MAKCYDKTSPRVNIISSSATRGHRSSRVDGIKESTDRLLSKQTSPHPIHLLSSKWCRSYVCYPQCRTPLSRADLTTADAQH